MKYYIFYFIILINILCYHFHKSYVNAWLKHVICRYVLLINIISIFQMYCLIYVYDSLLYLSSYGKFPENSCARLQHAHAFPAYISRSPYVCFTQVNDLCSLSAARDGRADFINSGQISLSSSGVYYTLKSQRNRIAHPHTVKSKAPLKI